MSDSISQFVEEWIDEVHVNECAVIGHAKEFDQNPSKAWRTLESLLLLKAITLIDLTTLGGDDTASNVTALVNKALRPLRAEFVEKILDSIVKLLQKISSIEVQTRRPVDIQYEKTGDREYVLKVTSNVNWNYTSFNDLAYEDVLELKQLLRILGFKNDDFSEDLETFLSLKNDLTVPGFRDKSKKNVRVAAVCVYPKFVKTVRNCLEIRGLNMTENETRIVDVMPIAAVAAGFPSGQYDLESKTREIAFAIRSGASEIDIVISRCLVIGHKWRELFEEICSLKEACGVTKMKTILAVGECGSFENVYKASMVAMMAGSDYIKTSTGKETINATLPAGVVMCRAIKNFYVKTGKKVGFKPAGGIKTADDTLKWINLIITELGSEWLSYFRIGASGVLNSIVQRLLKLNS